MHASDTVDHLQALQRCEALVAGVGERAAQGEECRRLPDATVDGVAAADLWRMVVPTSLGGHGLGVETLAHSARILAHGCVATGWTVSFLMMHSWLLARFSEAARAEFFPPARPWALAPAPLAPTGTLRPIDDGYELSGRWEWATGVHHADWVMVHAIQTEPVFTTKFAVLPLADVVVEDVWHTSGMRATGSDTVVADNVFVPARRAAEGRDLMFGHAGLDGDGMAGLPVPPVLALVAAGPALGAAERAVELFRQRIEARVLAYSLGDRAVEQPAAQMRLGAAMSDLASAQARWNASIDELAAAGRESRELPTDRRMAMRLSAAATVRAARAIVNGIAEGAGASVYFESSPLQRLQRDLEVLKGHVIFDWDRTTELAGKVALGLPLKPTDLV